MTLTATMAEHLFPSPGPHQVLCSLLLEMFSVSRRLYFRDVLLGTVLNIVQLVCILTVTIVTIRCEERVQTQYSEHFCNSYTQIGVKVVI